MLKFIFGKQVLNLMLFVFSFLQVQGQFIVDEYIFFIFLTILKGWCFLFFTLQ